MGVQPDRRPMSSTDPDDLPLDRSDLARQLRFSEPLQRWSIAALTLVFGVCGALTLLSPAGTGGSPVRTAIGLAVSLSTIPAAVWVARVNLGSLWITKEYSTSTFATWFVVYADVAVGLVLSAMRDPWLSLHGTTIFAVVGGFVAHFSGKRVVAAHLAFTSALIAVFTGVLLFRGQYVATVIWFALVSLVAANATVLLVRVYADESRRALFHQMVWANTDALTTLLNRRGFHSSASTLVRSSSTSIGVAVLDIDNYKHINDAHGHAVGDHILAEFGSALRSIANPRIAVARIGGDEFAIAAIVDAAQLRTLIESVRAITPDLLAGENLTISAGAVVRASPGMRSQEVLEAFVTDAIAVADRALYEAKRDGRNTVCVVDETITVRSDGSGNCDLAQPQANSRYNSGRKPAR